MARALLIAGAVVLFATALFHMSGLESVAGWLEGDRGRIVALLWASAALNWTVVALIWIFAAAWPSPALRWPVWISAIIPVSLALFLLSLVDPTHPGGYMLLLSAILAVIGGWRLR